MYRALGRRIPNEAIYEAYVKTVALVMFIATDQNQAIYRLDQNGNFYLPIPRPEKVIKLKNKTRKKSAVAKYLQYLEWADKNKYKGLIFGNFEKPTISQIFSVAEMGSRK